MFNKYSTEDKILIFFRFVYIKVSLCKYGISKIEKGIFTLANKHEHTQPISFAVVYIGELLLTIQI